MSTLISHRTRSSTYRVLSFCRIGFTCRCIHSCLFGIPTLPGGQAEYIRIPKAGGTLFNLGALQSSSTTQLADSSLILLADILPTGVFAAMQALQHPKIAPMLTGAPYPFGGFVPGGSTAHGQAANALQKDDRILTIGIVGLGPVGVVSHSSKRATRTHLLASARPSVCWTSSRASSRARASCTR